MIQEFNKQKDLGNNLFKEKKYKEALQVFSKAYKQIQKNETKQYLTSTTELSKLYVILLINSAFACINIKSQQAYQQAIELCNKAITIDQKNVKALFRRGIARKQQAQQQQKNKGVTEKLLQNYTLAKEDFEKVNLIQRSNQLAQQKFNQTVKDIYRVTLALNKNINFTTSKKKEIQQETSQSNINNTVYQNTTSKKKGINMEKIMQQYKVFEVSQVAKKKVYQHYLQGELPTTRSQLQKAIRQIKSNQQIFLSFIYRFDDSYLNKISPTFDMISDLVNAILNGGSGQQAKRTIKCLKNCKSFNLYWKSLVSKQKTQFVQKWKSLGLDESELK